jgi:hypothetical protein
MVLVAGVGSLWADVDNTRHSESVEKVMSEIRAELGLKANERIDPAKVSQQLLEELGDAVMGTMHPDSEQHEWMDQMMGGEGSESLAAAHRWMGYRYLSGGYGSGFGMMGGGMMGPGMMGRSGMMGDSEIPFGSIPYESPEDILKRRYAQGDISRQEYLQMLEDLKGTE